jgi:hypothetical protein
MAMCRRLNHSTNSHKLKWIGGEGATTCNLSNSAPSGRRDNFAAFGVEEMLDHFTRVVLQKMDRDVKSPSCAPIYAAIPKRFDTNLTCI